MINRDITHNDIMAGIVLYDPDIVRLKENVYAVKNQVDRVLLVDNNSKNVNKIRAIFIKDTTVYLIENTKNLGVATALNQIMTYAEQHEYEWVLTLDQDSVVSSNIINEYERYLNIPNIGIVCCKICDRNFERERDRNISKECECVKFCITSGALTNVDTWKKIGGFDDFMFIDSVDVDFCISLNNSGYKIVKTYLTYILHEVGHSYTVKLFGREELVLNHSPFRCYYIIRNEIYLGRKYDSESMLIHLLRAFKRILIVMLYEKQKISKGRAMLKGFIDGFGKTYKTAS